MSIATKTGDKGQTSINMQERAAKNHPYIEIFGLLDELNASIGMALSNGAGAHIPYLSQIQNDLFNIGAEVSNPQDSNLFAQLLHNLESNLSELEPSLPPLKNFILPGGHPSAAATHLARTICRRAERFVSGVENQPEGLLPYLNRLSDFLFLSARKCNIANKTDETIWNKESTINNQ
ncbi:cob(I)yrinic acid a,c-diamide adenosyltransferase [Candidatus Peregrinibacteria bacterium]|jgi:cob(I)alamin adenosyltransferase|nr:cob(I)yrinic acid a,c-diamide adenosyltransferase [Candidatus Peregrinibacteria bacterium]MBT4631801.1 cob(I)yrinic acid a,c-diamide adenosyltransferase [Candidatus Peregrinibacteria bacterium]MBT5516864.1 cob(I)yrinic acid a,c-diamide adenosyltransferase [Candidatus Peregrinibacteria bacterium]MBT5824474.1 cob(I)yrinic acid a,c-diamide adenosyltransferase [Candidatus Peregrinibacteria bacterium]